MTTDDIDSAAVLDGLLRVLRRYALSDVGPAITKELLELAEDGRNSMTVMEVGSLERRTAAVCCHIFKTLAELLVGLAEDQGRAILDARVTLEDIDPDDFSGEPW